MGKKTVIKRPKMVLVRKCTVCDGQGRYSGHVCGLCDGSGGRWERQMVVVKVREEE